LAQNGVQEVPVDALDSRRHGESRPPVDTDYLQMYCPTV